ncbi:glycosyltransferase family 39 protein [Micromonospora soli]|uniref:glycosyltransferase family 39 protein n=1 Tax=Micromonospora sp. NBRC 110009 TaxID=3061627 RepID=UPI0026723275|nr:glycosyltransferase family 39 protein [Micromonospora sp. NBRC 110009]WKT99168.1 glycosyltransferase family 39 protein [Micromonospora sp. NBRC 110009]
MKDADTMVLSRPDGPVEIGVEDPWGEDRVAGPGGAETLASGGTTTRAPRWRVAAWLVPALLMGALGAVRASTPGLRTEELVTWRSATSPWRDSWSALYRGDGTMTPYHLLMRAWAEAFGASDLALRVPSILAMAAAAALLGAAVARMFTPGTGVLAGVIFALLPASTRYAQEAQPYALTLLAAVLATWLLLCAVDRPRLWRFAAYAGAVIILGLAHALALLLLVGHGWAVLAFRRGVVGRWLAAAFLGALPAAALVWLAVRDGGQLFPASRPSLTALAATPRELFGAATLGALLLGLALLSLPLRYAAAVFTAWAVVPPLVLLLAAQATPIWSPQWLLFTLPAWAALGAAALSRVRVRLSTAVVAVIALISAPVQLATRAADGHEQDTRQLARIIGGHVQSGDGVVYGAGDTADGAGVRNVVTRYLRADRRPVDVLPAAAAGDNGRQPVAGCADDCLRGVRRLWVIRVGERTDPVPPVLGGAEALLRSRYHVAQVWRPTGFTLALLVDERPDL